MDMTKAALMAEKAAEGNKTKTLENVILRNDNDDEEDDVIDSDDDGIEVEDYDESNCGNWKGNENVLKIGNKYYKKFEYFENGVKKIGTIHLGHSNLINFKNKMLDTSDEYVEEEGKYYQKFYHYVGSVRKCTRVLISKDTFDSETKPKNDLSIMPPPPSPAWRKVATPKRENNFLKSPFTELFTDDNLTDCQAVPNNLFSPMRQAELVGGKIPRYQEIPLDYPQPRSVDSNNLDSWLCSPGGPPTPGRSATPSGPRTPGPSGSAHATSASSANLHHYENTKLVVPEAPVETPIAKAISKDIDVQIDLLAKNAEKDKKLKSDIFKQMNNILNDVTISSDSPKQTRVMNVAKASESVRPVRAAVKTSPDKSVSRGSWRFSSEHSAEPFVPVVKVKNDSLTRPMVLSKAYDFYQPIVKAIAKNESKVKKRASKDENAAVVSKRQKVEDASEPLVPASRKVNYYCKDCRKRCSSLRDVKAHLCLPKVQCEDCKPAIKNFQNRKLLMQHLSHSHPAVGQRFACNYCEKGASNKTYLRDHVKKYHPTEFIEIYGGDDIVEQNESVVVTSDSAENANNDTNETDIPESAPTSAQDIMDEIVASHEAEAYTAVESAETCEEDIDAPDSVVNTSHNIDDVIDTPPQPFAYHCEKCKKGFHTNMRHKNHRKNCGGPKKVSIDELVSIEDGPSKTNTRLLQKLPVTGKRSVRGSSRRRNARFEQLKSNWSELMEGRERCGKCGRNNYREDDLEKHKRVCRGTLMDRSSRYICPHCTEPSRVFHTENAMRRHVSTNHAKEAMEDEWDYEYDEDDCNGLLAKKHLFR